MTALSTRSSMSTFSPGSRSYHRIGFRRSLRGRSVSTVGITNSSSRFEDHWILVLAVFSSGTVMLRPVLMMVAKETGKLSLSSGLDRGPEPTSDESIVSGVAESLCAGSVIAVCRRVKSELLGLGKYRPLGIRVLSRNHIQMRRCCLESLRPGVCRAEIQIYIRRKAHACGRGFRL